MKTLYICIFLFLFSIHSIAEDFWMQMNRPTGGRVFSLAVNNKNEVFAGMGNGVYLTNDDGETWEHIGLLDITVYSLLIHQNGNIFAGTGGGGGSNLFRMDSIGGEWTPLPIPGTSNVISIMSNSSGDLFISNNEIFKSTDNGDNWTKVFHLDNTQTITGIAENNDGVMFAGVTSWMGFGDGGGVYRSFDNGDTWEHVGLHNKYISSLAVSSTGVLFAGSRGDHEYGGGGVFRSENNGITWEKVAYNVWVTSIAIDPNDVLYIGCTLEHGGQGGVFRSLDNGKSWELIVSGMGNYPNVEGLSLAPDGYLYAYKNSLYRSVEPVFISSAIPTPEKIDIKIFPNPFSDFLHVELPNDQVLHGYLTIKIFDFAGKPMLSQNINHKQGRTMNLASLPPGLYYISIELNGQLYARPILKVLR